MKYLLLTLLALSGCKGVKIIDRSMDAFAAGDSTVVSSCVAAPGKAFGLASGVDGCRFTEGDGIEGNWVLVAPPIKQAKGVSGGTVDVYYKDLHKSYSVTDWTVPIPFKDFYGADKWSKDLGGILTALVTINWFDETGVAHVTSYRGIAVVIVTSPGYEKMPIDSGNSAWGSKCYVEFSTAGRSALRCK